ncbi:hypothetical protein J1605_011227 [Eschrichtius robustus]|uniref:Uncharacterized protein n=1 Tax=Eschrichtius robustus TaxID=9764 RepID=A0AB34GPT4_ESCRO|nr:hypothetical protein J1605_011227 [Eschrichtius robustus]
MGTDRDIGIYQYYDKKEPPVSATEHGNLEEKQKLAESRDFPWTLKNRRPEKLRDSLKELEELMQNSQCVLSKWKNKYVCQVKRFDMLSQCLTIGAENYAVIGILVL